MGTNKFFVFDESRANLLSDQEYQNSDYRKGGAVAGVAPSNVHNKMYLQSSTMAAAIAQVIADTGKDVSDFDFNLLVLQIKEALVGSTSGWRREHPFNVSDISTPSAIGSYKYMECTVAGTTGATEPTWPAVGETVTDGSVTWIVRDVRAANPLLDGTGIAKVSDIITKGPWVDVRAFGAKGDGVTDDTEAIQSAIDYANSTKRGVVVFHAGVYLVKSSLSLYKNTVLEGLPPSNIQNSYSGVIFACAPSAADTDIITCSDTQSIGYVSGIKINNITLRADNNNCRYALNLPTLSNFEADSVFLQKTVGINGFVDGIIVNGYMQSTFSNCYLRNCQNASVRFTGGLSTTVTFNHCYFTTSNRPIIAEAYTALGVSFNDCIFESCEYGIDIATDNVISFNNPYSENIPLTPGPYPILQLGVNGTPRVSGYPQLKCSINGGDLSGNNTSIDDGSSVIKCDLVGMLSVSGLLAQRAGKLLITTANTKTAVLSGIFAVQIASLKDGIYDQSKVIWCGYNDSSASHPYLFAPRIEFNGGSGAWKLFDRYRTTDSNLDIINGKTGNIPLSFDVQDNISHNFTGSPGEAHKVDIFGPITAPTWTGIGVSSALWAETINGVVQMRIRDSAGNISAVGGDLAVTTANRPTTGLFVGKRIFDTTLNKPVWYGNTGWVDANGTSI